MHFLLRRLRIGIGPKNSPFRPCTSTYVLSKFDTEEMKMMPYLLDYAVEALRVYVHRGGPAASSIVNGVSLLDVMKREKDKRPVSLRQ